MKASGWIFSLVILTHLLAFRPSLAGQNTGHLTEKQVKADVSRSYKAYLQGGKHVMQLSEDEKDTDFDPLIRSGRAQVVEGYFSSLAHLEALALIHDGRPVGPEWGLPKSLLAHYTCLDGSWQLAKVETWYHNFEVQDVDTDGVLELWVNLAHEGFEAGGQMQILFSYAGGSWNTLWESSGEDRRPHTDFDNEPPHAQDVLAEIQAAEFRWVAGEPKPVMYVRHERSVCNLPVCHSPEELETTVEWVRMRRAEGKYIPAH